MTEKKRQYSLLFRAWREKGIKRAFKASSKTAVANTNGNYKIQLGTYLHMLFG